VSANGASEVIFTFESSHYAIAAERQLLDAGIQVRVMPLPASIGAGCGICLRVWPDERTQAAGALTLAGIRPQGVWRRISDGNRTRYVADGE
jgi:transposase